MYVLSIARFDKPRNTFSNNKYILFNISYFFNKKLMNIKVFNNLSLQNSRLKIESYTQNPLVIHRRRNIKIKK
jgi:hypothetical protein